MAFLDKLNEVMNNLAENVKPFDPGELGDAVAMNTSWQPLVKDGFKGHSHSIREMTADRLQTKTVARMFLVPFLIIFIGIVLLLIALTGSGVDFLTDFLTIDLKKNNLFQYIVIAAAVFMLAKGLNKLRLLTKTVNFDRSVGYYWRGKPGLDSREVKKRNEWCTLADIHALQIIEERIYVDKSTGYSSYELNLVLKNSERLNVMDHSDLLNLRRDAKKISEFLNVPVWDSLRTVDISGNMTNIV